MVIRTSETNVTVFDTNQCMYNLTVEDAHTFFVGDGDWLVHNDNCWDNVTDLPNNNYWNRTVEYDGHRIYQRNDLIDPDMLTPNGSTNLELMQAGYAPLWTRW